MLGCATVRSASPCSEPACKVPVSVGANCAISPGPNDELEVARGNAPTIHWELEQQSFQDGWQFERSNGIEFKTPTGGEIEFVGHSPRVVTFNNRHTKEGKYRYGINLVNRDGRTCRQDPFVVNR
jgi:hypothetical protein